MALNLLEEAESRPYYIKLILQEFALPITSNIFFINKAGLKLDADFIEFDKIKWRHNPRQFCQDQYGIQEAFPIILMMNNISSYFEFIPDNIINNKITTPKYNFITSILDQK